MMRAIILALFVLALVSSTAALESTNYNLRGAFQSASSSNYIVSGSLLASTSESASYRLTSAIWWYDAYPAPVSISYKLGDLNGDGKVDFNDLVAVLNLILTGGYDPRGDMDSNGQINFNDLVGVLNIILGGG